MSNRLCRYLPILLLVAGSLAAPRSGRAQAVRTGFTGGTLARGDDTYSAAQALGFSANFFGTTFTNVYVSMNGYITFDGGDADFTPEGLKNNPVKIIAPFFADVDTSNSASGVVTWGRGTVNGRNAFAANWTNVGYFSSHADKLNTFQVVLIDRSDRRAGDFDFEFNYNSIQWEAGDLNGGIGGLCSSSCDPPSVGYSNGLSGTSNVSFEWNGSHVAGAFLDRNTSTGLKYQQFGGSGVSGRLLFQATNGTILTPTITNLSPSSINAGASQFNLTINGTNFASGATVRWTTSSNATTTLNPSSISPTQIVVAIPASLVTAAGSVQVSVNSSGAVSNSVQFTVNQAAVTPGISSLSPSTVQAGSAAFNLTINGTNFANGATVRWINSSNQTTTLTPSSIAGAQIVVNIGASLIANAGTYQVVVASSSGTTSNSATFTVTAIAAPSITIRPSAVASPTDQPTLSITLGSPATTALTGTLTIAFTPNGIANLPAGYIDPAAVFAAGGTTLNFTIPAGSTTPSLPNNGQFSQGTVAGTITVTMTALNSGSTSVLPNPRPSTTLTVNRQAPVITQGSVVLLNATSSGFTIEVQGYSTTRDLTTATFSFSPAGNAQVNGGPFTTNVGQAAQTTWFDTATGRNSGSRFAMQMPFTLSGDSSAIGSVTVTLANSAGTSAAVSGR